MKRYALLVATPVLLLAACTETEWPTAPGVLNTASSVVLQATTTPPGSIVSWGSDVSGEVSDAPAESDFVAVAGGDLHATALRVDGSLVSWGNDRSGRVSDTPAGNDFVAVAAGVSHGTALRADGSLVSWGADFDRQVSDTPAGNDFVAVAAGGSHGTALRADGSLVSWGLDFSGQVSDTPAGNDFVAVAAGVRYGTALRADSSLVSWGRDDAGQVSGTPAGNDFVAVAAGFFHGTALRADSSLVSWGGDQEGQISDTPAGSDFVAVAAGKFHSTALRADGSLVSWGRDDAGQVSDTPAGDDFVAVAAGGFTGYAIRLADEVPPTIDITSPPDGAVYLLGQPVLADYVCTDEDGGSDLASCAGTVANGDPIPTSSVGTQTFIVDASDAAGNTATLTHTYTVSYDFTGFSSPVKNDAVTAAKAGRTIPLKWRLVYASGQPVTDLGSVRVTVDDTGCDLGSTDDRVEESAPGASGLRHRGDGYYQFNWKTPRTYAGSCKMLHLDLGEGLTRTALFRFTR